MSSVSIGWSGGMVGSIDKSTSPIKLSHFNQTSALNHSNYDSFKYELAAIKIQSAVRGYFSRSKQIISLMQENKSLKSSINEKDLVIARQKNYINELLASGNQHLSQIHQNTFIESAQTRNYISEADLQAYSLASPKIPQKSSAFGTQSTINLLSNSEPSFEYKEGNSLDIFPKPFIPDSDFWSNKPQELSKPTIHQTQTDIPNAISDSELQNLDYVRQIWMPINKTENRIMQKNISSGTLPEFNPSSSAGSGTAIVNTQPSEDFATFPYLFDQNDLRSSFKALVDKIVKTNDQPSSIFLQQRIRTENDQVKCVIFEAILPQILALIKNRFGNFLIQCCLECGSSEQARVFTQKMKGHVIQLSCDRFGCHVMQKAIEKVDEQMKIELITELFTSVPETFTHRFSCHVWQRVFEIKWTCEPPAIMEYVQKAVGNWAEIAHDENGSLVVQCIFEHCKDFEKAPIIKDIFERTLEISRGQWGNWVIQHLLEHGTTNEQNHIMEVVLQNSLIMSIDQFASKVVEKCVKVTTKKYLQQFVEEITKVPSNGEEPQIIKMMNNQFGNYVVQNVLGIAETHQRNACIRLLTPHIPILRASKYGQRVAALCEKYGKSASQKYQAYASSGNNNQTPSSLY